MTISEKTIKNQLSEYKWYIIAGIIFLICLFFTPIKQCNSGFWMALGLSVPVAAFVFFGILKLDNLKDIFFFDFDGEKMQSRIILIPIASFFISVIILAVSFSVRIDSALMADGIFAPATITDGYSQIQSGRRGKKSTSYKLTVKFTDQNETTHYLEKSVNSEEYHKVGQGQEIEVIYLPEHPSIYKLLLSDSDIKRFKKLSNRNLDYQDLVKILEMNKWEVSAYLSSISQGWKLSEEDGSVIFENQLKNESIFLGDDYLYFDMPIGKFDAQLFFPKGSIMSEKEEKILDKNIHYYEIEGGYTAIYYLDIPKTNLSSNLPANIRSILMLKKTTTD